MPNSNIVLVENNHAVNQEQFNLKVSQAILSLKKLGIRSKQRVAILADNSVEYFVVLCALWQMKVIAVLLNTRLPKKAIFKQIKLMSAQMLLTDKVSLRGGTTKQSYLRLPRSLSFARNDTIIKMRPLSLDQELTIMFTSGSSGEPKAALHTYGNYYYNAKGANEHISFKSNDRWLLSLPLYHVGGLSIFFRALLAKATIVIPDSKNILEQIVKHKITHVSLVPTQLYRLLQDKKAGAILKELRVILLGGSAVSQSLKDHAKKLNLPIYLTYGLTEMTSQVATSLKCQDKAKVLKYRQVKIASDSEVLVKGKVLFKGYLNHRLIKKNGWFPTGDLGSLDKKGYLTVLGRKDAMFISGGENIQPEEIERCLYKLSAIEEAIVVDVPNKEFGARPVAFIKMSSGQKLNKSKIITHLQKYLPKFKIPDLFLPWPKVDNKGIKVSRKFFKKIVRKKYRCHCEESA